ncbi:MAG: transcription termination factor NusA [Dehalococcoidia bacterium]|nr:transcription termination factor NusA [Dehalococcoidia bacterium]MDD5493507.1 transcription termination factor NusA [Dehalococcoidia bacterium]
MAKTEFMSALMQLAAEKNLPKEIVLTALESAMVSAYRKEAYTHGEDIVVRINPVSGEVKLSLKKIVSEAPEDTYREILLKDAKKIDSTITVGDTITLEIPPPNAGRIPAQIAKQVILQKLHDAERGAIYEEFVGKEGEIITGSVQRVTPEHVIVDIGKTEAVIPTSEKVPIERYRPGQRLKLYIVEVARTSKGPQVIASRAHRNLLRDLLILEIPEIASGLVEIKAVAREAGYRSKVAVTTRQPGIDPVGCCVGLRGIRIQNIVNELNGEKIDVVQWSDDPRVFIANALSPAQVLSVTLNPAETTALVKVPDKHLSLAIGKEGQNVRLAAKLTGWRIDIKSAAELEAEKAAMRDKAAQVEEKDKTTEEAAELSVKTAEFEEAIPEEAAEIPEAEEQAPTGIEIVLPLEAVTPAQPSKIRFAEEILASKAGKAKKKDQGKKDTEGRESPVKSKKAKHKKTTYIEEEEYEG